MVKVKHPFYKLFPPSEPCTCDICQFFCMRPGWWLVEEAHEAIKNEYANRMMLEFSTDLSFAVLSPAFKGNEAYFALQYFSKTGCTFFSENRCTIFLSKYQPIECRFCHHDRLGLGPQCHLKIAQDWNSSKGKRLVKHWLRICNLQPPPFFHI